MSDKSPNRSDVITASEIGDYIYCSVSWYLQRCGHAPESPRLEEGTRKHAEVGEKLTIVQKEKRASKRLRDAAYIVLLISPLLLVLGSMLGFVVILMLALTLLLISRIRSGRAKRLKSRYGIPSEKVVYSDLKGSARTLFSRRYGIAGKPDYIVRENPSGAYIPVEVKSTNARSPYRGHVLQLAAYCLLIEEKSGTRVPYGILVYADGRQHRIPFDDALRSELLTTIGEMRLYLKEERVDRNHTSPRKCAACSFSDVCTQVVLNDNK